MNTHCGLCLRAEPTIDRCRRCLRDICPTCHTGEIHLRLCPEKKRET